MATKKAEFESRINETRVRKLSVHMVFEIDVDTGGYLNAAYSDLDQIQEAVESYATIMDWDTSLVLTN